LHFGIEIVFGKNFKSFSNKKTIYLELFRISMSKKEIGLKKQPVTG
jgi:hypothetical protein|tara:strand:- start:585 stop:722 length:138 start_codon:yes stop_codon:yes gene_type:complete